MKKSLFLLGTLALISLAAALYPGERVTKKVCGDFVDIACEQPLEYELTTISQSCVEIEIYVPPDAPIGTFRCYYIFTNGDINGDGKVDMEDLTLLGQAWQSMPGDRNWNQNADLNNDGKIDLFDLAIIGQNW